MVISELFKRNGVSTLVRGPRFHSYIRDLQLSEICTCALALATYESPVLWLTDNIITGDFLILLEIQGDFLMALLLFKNQGDFQVITA